MPELPEVETLRRELEREVVGRKIKSVEILGTRTSRRQPKKELVALLEGTKITGVQRKGKYLLLALDSGDILVVHLRMSGQLLKTAVKDPVAKHTHAVITFTQGGQLRFVDPRTFGELFVTRPDEIDETVPELAELGADPVEEPMSWTQFGQQVMSRSVKLKALLMDQTVIAGIGNIYSDEILFDAGLRYDRVSNTLSTMELRRLFRAVVETLHEAIKYGGTTLDDDQYVDLHGKAGTFGDHLRAYGRDKQACLRCRGVITKARFSQRSTYFCPDCQI